MATILACAGFAAICGSNNATAATMTTVALPEMKKYHYNKALSAGSIACGSTLGVVIPPIHIRDNLQLKPGGYAILIKGVEVNQGDLMVGYHLAIHPGETLRQIEGIPTREPTFNLPALWIPNSRKEEANI